MTIPTSTVPTAIANLLSQVNTQVATDANATTILVCQGEPGPDLPNDIIAVGTGHRRQVTWRTFIGSAATGALEEEYEIDVFVSSWSGDPDPVSTVNRAWVLAGYVETAVRTDPSLGGVVQVAQPFSTTGGDAEWTKDPAGRICNITLSIRCTVLN